MTTLRIAVLSLAGVLGCAACHMGGPPQHVPRNGGVIESRHISSWAMFGASNVNMRGIACSGRVGLKQGSATVKDSCFTGDTNVVLCTDVTGPNPVMCAPGKDALTVAGTGTDTISYARVR